MKKVVLALTIILTLGFCSACGSEGQVNKAKPATTDLSAVNVNEIVPGDSSEFLDTSKYTAVPKEQTAEKKNTIYFEELEITTDDNKKITGIKGIVGEGMQVNVNGLHPATINEVKDILGSNYNEYWFDREQNIKAYTYYDEAQNIYATFATFDDNIIWLILSK